MIRFTRKVSFKQRPDRVSIYETGIDEHGLVQEHRKQFSVIFIQEIGKGRRKPLFRKSQ